MQGSLAGSGPTPDVLKMLTAKLIRSQVFDPAPPHPQSDPSLAKMPFFA